MSSEINRNVLLPYWSCVTDCRNSRITIFEDSNTNWLRRFVDFKETFDDEYSQKGTRKTLILVLSCAVFVGFGFLYRWIRFCTFQHFSSEVVKIIRNIPSSNMNEANDQKSCFIPYEVMTIILGHTLPSKTIIQCRLVCHMWNHIIEHESWKYVVKLKENQQKPYSNAEIQRISQTPWYILHAMCAEDGIFGRNFVMTKHRSGVPFWKLTDPDSPCWQTVPTDIEYATQNDELSNSENFFKCKMQVGKLQNSTRTVQIIRVPKCGLSGLILKTLRPEIHVSFWVYLEAGLEVSADRDQRPKYHALLSLRSSALEVINEERYQDRSNLLLHTKKGHWKKVTLANQKASESKTLDSILIEHLLYNTDAKCMVTRILIRIEKPNFLDVDWNSVLENRTILQFESVMISNYPTLLKKVRRLDRAICSSILPIFDTHVVVLAFPASEVFIPGIWYGRPLADVIKIKDDDVDAPICYENSNHLQLYELRYKIHLKEHGLFSFIMDELQPSIYASIEYKFFKVESRTLCPYNPISIRTLNFTLGIGTNPALDVPTWVILKFRHIFSNKVIHRDRMKYELMVSLLDNEGNTLHEKKASEVLSKLDWKKLSLRFKNYGQGVTYIVINIQRHMSMNRCTQVVHGPSTFTFLNHVKSVVNAARLQVCSPPTILF